MACVRSLDGTDVMTAAEYSSWDEMRGQEDGDCAFDALRRHLAKRCPISHWHLVFPLGGCSKINQEQNVCFLR